MPVLLPRHRAATAFGILAWIALLLWAAFWIHAHGIAAQDVPDFLHRELGSSAWAIPAIFALFAIRPFLLLPVWTLCAAAGVLFGPVRGTLIALVAVNLATWLLFASARAYARDGDAPRRPVPALFTKIDDALAEHGFVAIFLLRFVYIPFDGLSIVAGISRTSFGTFALATLLGTLPSVIGYTLLGSSARNLQLVPIVAAVLLLAGAAVALARHPRVRRPRRARRRPPATE